MLRPPNILQNVSFRQIIEEYADFSAVNMNQDGGELVVGYWLWGLSVWWFRDRARENPLESKYSEHDAA